MSTIYPPLPFSDDAPKTELRQDKLGVVPFARLLADILIRLPAPNGYVIGLHGGWGSGKTTVLNFVRRYIDKHNQESREETALFWLEFRPWMASGHRDLTSAYFKVLGEALKSQPKGWKQKLKHARSVSDAVFDSVDKLSWLTAYSHGGVLPAGIKVVKGGYNTLVDKLVEEPSLQREHARLADALRDSGRKLLVVIDDLDRLRSDEIQQMMMMVKTVGQLPNVIYLLSYDQRIVWTALAEGKQTADDLPSYAEKIIQQELALPVPEQRRLMELFQAEIGFISLAGQSGERIQSLLQYGLRRWLMTPRDVFRFSNNLRFAWGTVSEWLDPIDYIAIEGLRTFDKTAFEFIRDNRDFFFPPVTSMFGRDRERIEAVERFRSTTPARDLRPVTAIATLLFPQCKAAFEHTAEEKQAGKLNSGYGENVQIVRKRRGLGFEDSYDTYFQFYPPAQLQSRTAVDAFMAHLNNEDWLFGALNSAQDNVRLDFMLLVVDLMRDVADRIASPDVFRSSRLSNSTLALLRAVVRVFDVRLRPPPPRNSLNSLGNLLSTVLEDYDQKQSTEELIRLFASEVSVGTAAHLTHRILIEMGSISSERAYIYERIGRENGEKLARVVVDRIQSEMASGAPVGVTPLYDVLSLWQWVSGLDAPKNWISQNLTDPNFLREVVSLFVYRDADGTWRAYHSSHDDQNGPSRFFDIGALHDSISRLIDEPAQGEQAMLQVALESIRDRPEEADEADSSG